MRTRRPALLPLRGPPLPASLPPDVIVLAVRWYLRFGLSYRDVEELLAERGIEVDHVTIYVVATVSPAALDVLHTVLAPVTQRLVAKSASSPTSRFARPIGAAIHRADPPPWALPT